MKTLQKYAKMTFLLLSAATIVPAYANPTVDEQEQVQQIKQEETIVEARLKPTTREKIQGALAFCAFCAIYVAMGYIAFKYLIPAKQDPFDVRMMNVEIEKTKLIQHYEDLIQMSKATVWELSPTYKDDLLKAVIAIFNKYGIKSEHELYTLVDGTLFLRSFVK
jgi:hypothetical protein